jgi:ankyrin repeat protein
MLYFANDRAVFSELLKDPKIDINQKKLDGQTVFESMIGAYRSTYIEELAEELLKFKSLNLNTINTKLGPYNSNGQTLLESISDYFEKPIFTKILLDPRLDVNLKNAAGDSALMAAMKDKAKPYGKDGLIEKLLTHPNIDVNTTDINGKTLFTVALELRQIEWAEKLLKFPKFNFNHKNSNNETHLTQLLQFYLYNSHRKDLDAGVFDYIQKQFVKMSAQDINLKNQNSDNPLLLKAVSLKQDLRYLRMILSRPDIEINSQNSQGNTIVMILADSHDPSPALAELLRHPKVDVNVKNNEGKTALMIAFEKSYEMGNMKNLMAHPKINKNAKYPDGETILQKAKKHHHDKVIQLFEK